MVAISIMIEGQNGLDWPRWRRLIDEVEALGFAGLFRSDHFTNARPPDIESLEMIVSLAYLADHTQRIHFGPLVAPVSFRHPTLLARQAAAIDDLSGGRMILGLGAGWQDREHTLFGHELGDVPTRMDRLEEGLEVITRLLRSDEPVTFEGRFFQLRGATLLPRPQRRGGPRIMIGGNGPRRTLPLAARYADGWNGTFMTPEAFRARSAQLDDLARAAGRRPGDIRRTMMTVLLFGRDQAALEQRVMRDARPPDLADASPAEVLAALRGQGNRIVGTAEDVVAQIQSYGQAGVEELMLQWFELDDIDGLRAFAEQVLPRL
jgi:F420-dependent oxidoreductase-like protein